ncbi:MAG: GNAT family N-acetyltransferase [Cyclobacteriaceae bacterium]
MNNLITYPTTLFGETVDLISLEKSHFPELESVAKEKRIWEFYAFDGSDSSRLLSIYNSALLEREKGKQFPFVIFHKVDKKIIGSTRFLDIDQQHRKLEIGTTWLHPDYWATEVNLECKLLLLTHCFENLSAVRVQLKTDENNLRSRKAIEKIGGHFEGILRNEMIRDNNTNRNSAFYSIIDSEWSEKKNGLMELYLKKKASIQN